MKRILLLGSNGMAGHIIKLYLQSLNKYNIVSVSRDKNNNDIYCDVNNIKSVEDIIDYVNPSIIINCIGLLNNLGEEEYLNTIFINSFFPLFLKNISKQKNIKIIHLSTDCVFSGLQGMYKEDDIKDEKSIYGLSKNIGEIDDEKNLTFRMSIIGPEIKNNGTGLFNWFMMQKGKIKGYNKVYWTGITTLELAKAIDVAIMEDLKGIYHLVCNERISKYDLLCMVKEIFNKEDVIIQEDDSKVSDKSMVNSRSDFSFRVNNYREMLKELKNWIYDNKELYKKYL